ncbi:hypothetical protein ABZ920_29085 [Streptomyces sp. NPDC046831]|uniref:hypothetical protein n=1 Tax=Streptomyces sp. NPDC046831 TaxID=3154805 RepID=UPI0033D91D94
MTSQDPAHHLLYTDPLPVSMGDRGGPARPGTALLFSTDDGELTELPRKPTVLGSLRYCYRYEVDLSDHTVSWSEPLPSGTGGFAFQADFEARWKVSDPAEVVRRGIRTLRDGQEAVCVAMRDLLWPHAAQYGIERLQEFAGFVRTSLCSRRHRLATGLTVDALTVRVGLDDDAAAHLRALKQREFDQQLAVAGHTVAMTTQSLDAELQAKRREGLLAAARGEGGLLLDLIAQDPSKLHEIMRELGARHDVAVEQKGQMLRDLVAAGHIQPAEAQQMWYDMQRPAPLFAGGPTGPAAVAPAAAPAQLAPAPAAQPAAPSPAPGSHHGTAAAPPAVVAGVVVPSGGTPEPPKPRRRAAAASAPHRAGGPAAQASRAGGPAAQASRAGGSAAQVSPAGGSAAQVSPGAALAAPLEPPLAPEPAAHPGSAPASPEPVTPGGGSANVTGETRVGPRRGRDGRRGPGAGS